MSLPPWPSVPPQHGGVVLREATEDDAAMVQDLSTDPYVPQIGTLARDASPADARAWIRLQLERHRQGAGFPFVIADAQTSEALGHCGLWLREIGTGRGSAGYAVAPSARGRGVAADALIALTAFAWTIEELHRVELHIEPWNAASIRTAEQAGYHREGLLRSHQVIAGERRDMLLYATVRP